MSTPQPLPLDGITVVAVEQAVSAPFATRQLADLGARVIKVERPDGGDFARHYDTAARGLASHFVWCNRGKESIALDLKDPRGLDILRRLIAGADVFVQNLAHGAAARMGLDAATLCAAHPRLVAVDISGYGADGPYAHKRAYDMLVQCEAGLVSVTGTPEQPVKAGVPAADIAAAMYAYSGVLAALLRRGTTGRGGPVEVSMLDSLAEWLGHPLHHVMHGGTEPARTGVAHAVIAPYNAYATADGQVLLSVQNDREWRRLTEQVLERPELAVDPAYATNTARTAHRAATDKAVGEALAGMTAAEALGRLEAAGIACARLNTVTEVAAHPQLAARDRWREVDSPVGPLRALLPPVVLPGGAEPRMGAVPALGEHTEALLRALGMTEELTAALRRDGVIA